MEYVFWIIFGIVLGVAITLFIQSLQTVYGVLRIDRTNPEKHIYRFDVGDRLEALEKKKRIILKVDPNADLSQK